ncbi:MAG TPA: NAD(P)H-binding protein [Prolixibacteraceae bacterium]|nr:NAD(P)H-binding protein [Prolixibacteraceae bacterium]
MTYVVLGSLGHISKPLAEKLIAAGHSVTVVSSNPEKAEQIILMGAKAAIGSVEDVRFLTHTFVGANAVYTMVPPNFAAANWKQYIAGIGDNYVTAIKTSGVKNVVNLSSMGAHMHDGCGPVSGLFHVEKSLNGLAGVNVKHLRPGFFYTNLLSSIGLIKGSGIIGGNYGNNATLIFTHPNDIAEVAAHDLLGLWFRGKSIHYIASDEKNTSEVAAILGKAIGKPDLKWINFSDQETLDGMLQAGLPEDIARNYMEMGAAMRNGEMQTEYLLNRPTDLGKTKLEDFAREFATVYNQTQPATKSRMEH